MQQEQIMEYMNYDIYLINFSTYFLSNVCLNIGSHL